MIHFPQNLPTHDTWCISITHTWHMPHKNYLLIKHFHKSYLYMIHVPRKVPTHDTWPTRLHDTCYTIATYTWHKILHMKHVPQKLTHVWHSYLYMIHIPHKLPTQDTCPIRAIFTWHMSNKIYLHMTHIPQDCLSHDTSYKIAFHITHVPQDCLTHDTHPTIATYTWHTRTIYTWPTIATYLQQSYLHMTQFLLCLLTHDQQQLPPHDTCPTTATYTCLTRARYTWHILLHLCTHDTCPTRATHTWYMSCSCDRLMDSRRAVSTFSFNFSSSCWVVSMQYSAVQRMEQMRHCSSSVSLLTSPSFRMLWISVLADVMSVLLATLNKTHQLQSISMGLLQPAAV